MLRLSPRTNRRAGGVRASYRVVGVVGRPSYPEDRVRNTTSLAPGLWTSWSHILVVFSVSNLVLLTILRSAQLRSHYMCPPALRFSELSHVVRTKPCITFRRSRSPYHPVVGSLANAYEIATSCLLWDKLILPIPPTLSICQSKCGTTTIACPGLPI